MTTNLVTRTLNNPQYLLLVDQENENNSYIGKIIKRQGQSLSEGAEQPAEANEELIFLSFPQPSAEQAEKAAVDYYVQINK
ncbi:hypothetical protein [Paenibacillus sp. J2TS4]|uniref:hypothetical protein n=1 Tax=Paenibacillus sp. J2TS4 TaxID=2807194 RepID=UPI001B296672|nr:hypothetical protein [Paenibacillus sp. J2TS4]GIP31542.1 hypothetical protein J2TS4_07520 [Paenibacillus sp. J2TS4]